jgi:hypothetical protein
MHRGWPKFSVHGRNTSNVHTWQNLKSVANSRTAVVIWNLEMGFGWHYKSVPSKYGAEAIDYLLVHKKSRCRKPDTAVGKLGDWRTTGIEIRDWQTAVGEGLLHFCRNIHTVCFTNKLYAAVSFLRSR